MGDAARPPPLLTHTPGRDISAKIARADTADTETAHHRYTPRMRCMRCGPILRLRSLGPHVLAVPLVALVLAQHNPDATDVIAVCTEQSSAADTVLTGRNHPVDTGHRIPNTAQIPPPVSVP